MRLCYIEFSLPFSYERTPIMSTYLLAFIVGEFDFVEGTDKDGVKVRVYTPLGKKEQVHVTKWLRMVLVIAFVIAFVIARLRYCDRSCDSKRT